MEKDKPQEDSQIIDHGSKQVQPTDLKKLNNSDSKDGADKDQQGVYSKPNLIVKPVTTTEKEAGNKIINSPAKPKLPPPLSKPPRPLVWDCGSSLYDSFELNSFKRQLDLALTAANRKDTHNNSFSSSSSTDLGAAPTRTHSMPHLSHGRLPFKTSSSYDLPPGLDTPKSGSYPTAGSATKNKQHSKLSRSFNKLLRSLIPKSKHPSIPTKLTKTIVEQGPLNTWELDHENDDNEEEIRRGGSARWILVYDDDILYDDHKDMIRSTATSGGDLTTTTTAGLSTILEVPEEVPSSPVVVNVNHHDHEVDIDTKLRHHHRRRLSWSSSSPLGRRIMSDRFTGRSTSDRFSFISPACVYRPKQKQQQHRDDVYV